jgi:hypothetical protein
MNRATSECTEFKSGIYETGSSAFTRSPALDAYSAIALRGMNTATIESAKQKSSFA